MIWMEFIISFCASIIAGTSLIIIWWRTRNPPTLAVYYLNVALTFIAAAFFTGTIASYLHDPRVLHPLGTVTYSLGAAIAILGVGMASIALVIADFEPTTKSVFFFSLLNVLFGATAASAGLTNQYHLKSGTFSIHYHPLVLLALTFCLSIIIYLTYQRIKTSAQLTRDQRKSPFTSSRNQVIFLTLIVLQTLFLVLDRAFPEIGVPTLSWFIPSALMFAFFAYVLPRDPTFLFITNVDFGGLLIIDRRSSLTLYSHLVPSTRTFEDLIPMMFKGLDTIFQQVTHDVQSLEEISFGNKVFLISQGKKIITIGIVSKKTMVAREIIRHLTSEFEKMFSKELTTLKVVDTELFSKFTTKVNRATALFATTKELLQNTTQ